MVYAVSITNTWNCTIVLIYHNQTCNTFSLRLTVVCTEKIPLMWSQFAHSFWHFNGFGALIISYNIFSFMCFPWLFTKVCLWDIDLLSLMSLSHCVLGIMLLIKEMFTSKQWVENALLLTLVISACAGIHSVSKIRTWGKGNNFIWVLPDQFRLN